MKTSSPSPPPDFDARGLTLVMPERGDVERDAVARAWRQAGGDVLKLGRFWQPPPLNPTTVRLYGNETFCRVLEQILGLRLLGPDDRALLHTPQPLLRRSITGAALADAGALPYPCFIKSVVPKALAAEVFDHARALQEACTGLEGQTALLVSQVVSFVSEWRVFVLDGQALDGAIYEGEGGNKDAEQARRFAQRVFEQTPGLPRALVVDVGQLQDGRWALIEYNAAWGAGLNGCEASRVLPAIAAASGKV